MDRVLYIDFGGGYIIYTWDTVGGRERKTYIVPMSISWFDIVLYKM